MSTMRFWFGCGFALTGVLGAFVFACSSSDSTPNNTAPKVDGSSPIQTETGPTEDAAPIPTPDAAISDAGAPDTATTDAGMASTRTYSGAGSEYSVTVDPNAMTVKISHAPAIGAAPDSTIDGTYVTFPSGFLQLTVTASTGTNAPAVGSLAYGLEIPSSVFFLKPIGGGSSSNIIPMISSGTCPTAQLLENWVMMKVAQNWTESSSASGTFGYDTTSGAAQVLTSFSLNALTSDLGAQALGSGACANGTFSLDAGNGDFFLTAAGGAIVHINGDKEADGGDGIVFALPPSGAPIALGTLAGRYSGLVFSSGANQNFPVELTLAAADGGVSGGAIVLMDVATESVGNGGAYLYLSTAGATNGVVTGTIDTSGSDGGGAVQPLSCIVQQGAGTKAQTVLACAAVDEGLHFFSIALVARP